MPPLRIGHPPWSLGITHRGRTDRAIKTLCNRRHGRAFLSSFGLFPHAPLLFLDLPTPSSQRMVAHPFAPYAASRPLYPPPPPPTSPLPRGSTLFRECQPACPDPECDRDGRTGCPYPCITLSLVHLVSRDRAGALCRGSSSRARSLSSRPALLPALTDCVPLFFHRLLGSLRVPLLRADLFGGRNSSAQRVHPPPCAGTVDRGPSGMYSGRLVGVYRTRQTVQLNTRSEITVFESVRFTEGWGIVVLPPPTLPEHVPPLMNLPVTLSPLA